MNALTLAATRRRSSRSVTILDGFRRPDLLTLPAFSIRRALRGLLAAIRPALTAENLILAAAFVALLVLFASLPERDATAITVCSGVILAAIFIGIPATERKGGRK